MARETGEGDGPIDVVEVAVLQGLDEILRGDAVEPEGRIIARAGDPVAVAARPLNADFVVQDRDAAVVRPIGDRLRRRAERQIAFPVMAAEFTEQDVDESHSVSGEASIAEPPCSV